ncbi:MAG: tetratricopeptide repeat protein, partial [Pseudomonadales bacterium]
APLYAAARGDIHVSLGQRVQAIAAYEEALARLAGENSTQSNTIQLKLDSLRSGAGVLSQE